MRPLLLAGLLVLGWTASSPAMNPVARHRPAEIEAWAALLRYDTGAPLGAVPDTVRFGGDGVGHVIRGGVWSWETDSGEPPLTFPDGGPVGNQYRDGWTFDDRTTRSGPSQVGSGHWQPDGSYDLDVKGGAHAHRYTRVAGAGPCAGGAPGCHGDVDGDYNFGPEPLDDPDNPAPSSWSVWIGTNLRLNPEYCGWQQAAGHGNGWSDGIEKRYTITAPAGSAIDISFFHRYACESMFDTCWVEVSSDGIFWDQVGSAADPNGIYNGGTKTFDPNAPPGTTGPQPDDDPDGATESVRLMTSWPGGTADLYVRFRLATDAFFSDEGEGGRLFWGWNLDELALLVNGSPAFGADDFEGGMDGWAPRRFEGFDFDLTLDPELAAGRINDLAGVSCPVVVPCPEGCGLDGNIVMFSDRDLCDLNDAFMESYITSPAFSIGGAENPDIDGWGGRIITGDVYHDGGAGVFETGFAFCYVYYPFNANGCAPGGWSPPNAGDPGSGATFNWSRTGFPTCDFWIVGAGPACFTMIDDVAANLPADADSVILHIGAFSACRSAATCDIQDSGTPFFDNFEFVVFNTGGVAIHLSSIEEYADSFPLQDYEHQGMSGRTARSDTGHSLPMCSLGTEHPFRWVRSDSAAVQTGAQNAAMYLRFKVEPGPCTDLSNPFFGAFAPGVWHEARMDTGRAQGTGVPVAGIHAACFHQDDPNDGASWGGEAVPVEPCDDILPDGVFEAGTTVHYFAEARDATTGEVIGTAPRARSFAPIDTTAGFARFWLEYEILPEVVSPNCLDDRYYNDPSARPNNVLVIADSNSGSARTRMRAFLSQFAIDYDWYDVAGTAFTCGMYNGIGRREDRPLQVPRPPVNGATAAQLEPYDCIWYYADLLDRFTLSDQETLNFGELGGHPTNDQQRLEGWLQGCADAGETRLLIMDGYGWASDIDDNTAHGPAFLAGLGTDVLDDDYAAAAGDRRRCARLEGVGAPGLSGLFAGEAFGSGCPEDIPADILAPIGTGELVAHYMDSLEGGDDPVHCPDDVPHTEWAAIVRSAAGATLCRRSVTMGVSFVRVHGLSCADQCAFGDWTLSGGDSHPARLVQALFEWAGKPIGDPIGAPAPAASPPLVTALVGARPNPANPGATIGYSLARKGRVRLRIFDVSGRLVRTLVDEVVEPSREPYEVVWDGRNDAGTPVGSGVFFYQLDAPGHASARKLVILK